MVWPKPPIHASLECRLHQNWTIKLHIRQVFQLILDSLQLLTFLSDRNFAWGLCDIQNEKHSDFSLLVDCLLNCFPMALIEKTNALYFEYRKVEKAKRKKQAEQENNTKIAVGVGMALGVGFLGALFALKSK